MTKILESDIDEIFETVKGLDLYNKTVLLTGCGGFLGQYFLKVLEKFECDIIGIDNFIASDVKTFDIKKFEFIKQDISKPSKEFELLKSVNADYIIAAHGIASPQAYKALPLETIDSAISGTKNCFELAKILNAKILIFSSSEVYSGSEKMPLSEDDNGDVSTVTDRSCYDISKKMCETLQYVYCTKYGVQGTMIRPFNFYSGALRLNDGRLISTFASNILNKEPLRIYGDGLAKRSMTYITDGISGALLALVKGKSNEIYNIGNDEEYSVLEIAEKFIKLADYDVKLNMIEKPHHYLTEPMRRQPDITKAKKDFNFIPKVSVEEGLSRVYKAIF